MAYFLTVTRGADEGKSFRIGPGEQIVGRSPSSAIVLHDESVSWEHAVFRQQDSRLTLQNLSALGTRVRGRRVAAETRLRSRDEIELTDRCALRVEQRVSRGASAGPTPLTLFLLAVIVLLGAGAGAAVILAGRSETAAAPLTTREWRLAYDRIERRLAEWNGKGWFPEEGTALFREAWRLEHAGNMPEAAEAWLQLRSLLVALPLPGPATDERTVVQAAGPTRKPLELVMGRDGGAGVSGARWDSDENIADALAWFVRYRAGIAHRAAEPSS